jgi:hypothetical protein
MGNGMDIRVAYGAAKWGVRKMEECKQVHTKSGYLEQFRDKMLGRSCSCRRVLLRQGLPWNITLRMGEGPTVGW